MSFERKIPVDDGGAIPLFRDFAWPAPGEEIASVYCLIGGAIADGMGSPFESKNHETIRGMWSRHVLFPKRLAPLGLIHTDDTQLSLSLIESYLV